MKLSSPFTVSDLDTVFICSLPGCRYGPEGSPRSSLAKMGRIFVAFCQLVCYSQKQESTAFSAASNGRRVPLQRGQLLAPGLTKGGLPIWLHIVSFLLTPWSSSAFAVCFCRYTKRSNRPAPKPCGYFCSLKRGATVCRQRPFYF